MSSGLWNVLTGRYSTIGALTVLLYDYATTLDMEVEFVWSQELSLSVIPFLVNRYVPFVSVAIACYYILVESSFEHCRAGLVMFVVFCLIGSLSAELVFLLRADAIWGHRKFLRISLIVVFLVTGTLCSYFSSKHIASAHVIRLHYSSGCLYSFEQRNWAFMVVFAACDFFAFILLLVRRESDKCLASTALMKALYRESLMSFCLITALTIVNLVMEISAPPTLLDSFIVPEGILMSMVCSRMLLGVRRAQAVSRRRGSIQELPFQPVPPFIPF